MDSHRRHVCAAGHRRIHTATHEQPWMSLVCWWTPTDRTNALICVLMYSHKHPVYCPRGPKSPEQSTGRVSVLSPRANVLICVLMDSHRRPVPRGPKLPEQSTGRASVLSPRTSMLICALMDSHRRHTSCVCWRTPTDVLCVLNRQPTWAKITRTVHGKGQQPRTSSSGYHQTPARKVSRKRQLNSLLSPTRRRCLFGSSAAM
ncbi:unnamed protein product [Brassica rapa subsp. trilocularis]